MNEADYEQAVSAFYEALYAFAYSLAGNEDDACELTQETFGRLLTKGGQVRDPAKLKSWLFTTLYRVFLGWKQRQARLPHFEISSVERELPAVTPDLVDHLENEAIRDALMELDEHYRLPLMLYYLDDHSYAEVAGILNIPVGTVMSRLARGKGLLRERLVARAIGVENKVVPIRQASGLMSHHVENDTTGNESRAELPHPSPLPLRGGEGARRAGEGHFHSS